MENTQRKVEERRTDYFIILCSGCQSRECEPMESYPSKEYDSTYIDDIYSYARFV